MTMFERFIRNNNDLALVVAVLLILTVLFAPIPAAILDLLIITNFAFGLTILLMTFYVDRPVAFSTFPPLLLVATLFRLSLNVAATRLILTGASAGDVIGSIGTFAVQGNFIVGLVVFFILVVVQYVVVTAGAQRVSEVAARFVLDSVPGQQMSIDADLNMGLIDQNEAQRRRKLLEREAAFYGSMDGASKFVKGDAVAGIIILLIDILAGWAIGVAQMGMEWNEALQTFTLLTIGDGIVTQVPALIVSVATGIIVTRSSADRQLSTEIFSQLGAVPKIPLVVVIALSFFLLLPGMPKWPLVILLAIGLTVFIMLRRRARERGADGLFDSEPLPEEHGAAKGVPAIEVVLGKSLSQSWQGMKSTISERIQALRQELEQASGFAIPAVTVRDGAPVSASGYEILLHGARYGAAELRPEQTLAIGSEDACAKLSADTATDPAFGLPACWIDATQEEDARRAGLTLVDPVTVLLTHLREVARAQSPMLLSRSETVALLEGVRGRQPGLIEELVPAIMTVSDIQRILQNLLSEDVSIRNIDQIVEALVDQGRTIKDPGELTETVRQRISYAICDRLRGNLPQLSVLSLEPRFEGQIADSLRKAGGGEATIFDPRLAEQLLRGLMPHAEAMMQRNINPVLLCGPEIRRHLKTFTRRSLPRLAVVSVNEIPSSVDLASFAVVQPAV
jgi:flagellar biosynthesis protein FlhA